MANAKSGKSEFPIFQPQISFFREIGNEQFLEFPFFLKTRRNRDRKNRVDSPHGSSICLVKQSKVLRF